MERRRGRRDNGIDAADFAAVGDVDPRLAEHLLDILGSRGIAAYLQPSMDVDPITRSSTVPARPTDRLYADRAHLGTARDYLHRLLAESGPATGPRADRGRGDAAEQQDAPPAQQTGASDAKPGAEAASGSDADTAPDSAENDRGVGTGTGGDATASPAEPHKPRRQADSQAELDATFAGIVADFDRPVDPTAAAWPASENVSSTGPETSPAPSPPPAATGPTDGRHVTEGSLIDGLDTFGTDVPDGPDERFVPPPPPPLPRLSRQALLGGVAIVVGLALVLAPGFGPIGRSDSLWLGFAVILGGAVALILRLRPGAEPGEEQRPDDGAQV